MCRIAGIASPYLPLEEMQLSVAAMCRVQKHGGPDDEGMFTSAEPQVVFGHRRLSLLDLHVTGHQPMKYAGNRFTLTYNGEIYNYRELKDELQALGFAFQSSGDTEVVMAAFAAWGPTSFSRLNGMFAFALFDHLTAEIYLVRDVVGIKPLYYAVRKQTLAFASEVRAFYETDLFGEEHPYWQVYLMAYGHLPEPITTLKDVRPLQKGKYLKFNTQTGAWTLELFERLSFYEKKQDRSDLVVGLQQTLKAAVQRHLLSDAPIGVFLSGGVDSSILALLADTSPGTQLNTISLYFRETAYSEKQYQDLVLQRLNVTNHQKLLDENEFHYNLPEIIKAMDLPSSDGVNTWFIAKLAKEAGLKAVLSGIGGDELFGGYPSFHRIGLSAGLQSLPKAALRSGRYSRGKRWQRLAYLTLDGTKGQYLFLRGQFTPFSIAKYLAMSEEEVWSVLEDEPVLPDIHQLDSRNKASWMEFHLYMQNQLLRDADVMSMAHGVEIRVPFLDKEFVKTVFSVAAPEKYGGSMGKQLLVDAFQHLLPREVWQRKKMGFSFPFSEWLKEDEWVRSRMMSGGRESIELLHRFDRGQLHWSGLLTTLLLRTHEYEAQPAFFNA